MNVLLASYASHMDIECMNDDRTPYEVEEMARPQAIGQCLPRDPADHGGDPIPETFLDAMKAMVLQDVGDSYDDQDGEGNDVHAEFEWHTEGWQADVLCPGCGEQVFVLRLLPNEALDLDAEDVALLVIQERKLS